MVQESKPTGTSWTIPFEIKTGRMVGGIEHRAQTMLYTILVSERYGAFHLFHSVIKFDLVNWDQAFKLQQGFFTIRRKTKLFKFILRETSYAG